MTRLYYLADGLHTCELVGRTLQEAGVRDWNFHVLSKDEIGLYQHRIHAATAYQRLDIVHSGERWALGGAALGLAIGLGALALLPATVDGLTVTLLTAIGALAGAWRGALLGLGRESYKIARFHDALEAGRHLIMVDVADRHRAHIRELLSVRFPSVEFHGRDSVLIVPFARPALGRAAPVAD